MKKIVTLLMLCSFFTVMPSQDDFIQAAYDGNLAAMQAALEKNSSISIDARNHDGYTALMIASYFGHVALVEYLLKQGANIKAKSYDYWSALQLAVKCEIHGLEEMMDAPLFDEQGISKYAKIWKAEGDKKEIIAMLIDNGATFDTEENEDGTALVIFVCLGYDHKIASLLIHGANINAQEPRNKKTALMAAIENGEYDIARRLLQLGAKVNLQSDAGETALMFAINNGNIDMVKLLLHYGADLELQDNKGNTALIRTTYIDKLEIAQLLIEHGADINAQNHEGETPLIMGAIYKAHKIMTFLIERGADLNIASTWGTALFFAAQNNNLPLMSILLDHGAQIDCLSKKGVTALMHAAYSGSLQAVHFLLDNGANKNIRFAGDCTALMIAEDKEYEEIAELLKNHPSQF